MIAKKDLGATIRETTGEDLPAARGGIPVWHVVISGFTQRLESPSGAQFLWNAIRRARANSADAAALLEPWNADWRGIADLIWRFRPLDRPARVCCYAYSWGGGWGFPALARELAQRGIEIAQAVLCDAVYRPRWISFDWLALTRLPKIRVPANVREVSWFRQRTGLPAGHDVIAEDRTRTRVNAAVVCDGVAHQFMDDLDAWWLKSLSVAAAARPAPPYDSLLARLEAVRQ